MNSFCSPVYLLFEEYISQQCEPCLSISYVQLIMVNVIAVEISQQTLDDEASSADSGGRTDI
jgi:hypothetical protein